MNELENKNCKITFFEKLNIKIDLTAAVSRNGEKSSTFTFFFQKKYDFSRKNQVSKYAFCVSPKTLLTTVKRSFLWRQFCNNCSASKKEAYRQIRQFQQNCLANASQFAKKCYIFYFKFWLAARFYFTLSHKNWVIRDRFVINNLS
jgi:hypothetical protein